MNETRKQLLQLARQKDISSMKLREIARELDIKNPQTVKFHLSKLHDAGLIDGNYRASVKIEKDLLGSAAALIRIPILGSVSAGPATQIANDVLQGYLRVSTTLLKTKNYKDLFALTVVGTSMNQANVEGRAVNDGDYVIVDSSRRSPKDGDYVIAQVDGLANFKRYMLDKLNNQVMLLSESSDDYLPIFVHPSDTNEELIRGTVIQVMHRPVFV